MKSFSSVCVVLASVVGVACSSSSTTSSTGDGQARVQRVQAALASPTATVSGSSVKAVHLNAVAYADTHAAFDTVLIVGTAAAKGCLTGPDIDGSYDLNCATSGKVTGTLSFQASSMASDGSITGMVTAKLENACVGGECVTATVDLDIAAGGGQASATLAAQATITKGDTTQTFSLGAEGAIGGGALGAKVVYFDSNDDSVVVEAGAGVGPLGNYTVIGANGSFNCTVLGDGGGCTGAGVFTF